MSLNVQGMSTAKYLIYRDVTRNIIHMFCAHPAEVSRAKRRHFKIFRSTNKESNWTEVVILLQSQGGSLRTRVWFQVVEELVVDFLLGTTSNGKYLKRMFLVDRRFESWPLQSVEILMLASKTRKIVLLADNEQATAPADEARHNLLVAKPTMLVRDHTFHLWWPTLSRVFQSSL